MCQCSSLLGAAPWASIRGDGADAAGGFAQTRGGIRPTGPWVDVHARPGRCFLRGVPEDNGMRKALGPDDTDRAVEELHVGHVALSSSSTVADLGVLSIDANGIKAGREFEPGEAWSDHQRQAEALLGPTSSTK